MTAIAEREQEHALAEINPRTLGLQFETKLVEWQIPYTYYVSFPIKDVRQGEWAQVRESVHIADKDSLSEFRVQMKEGAVYPPIVLMDPNVLVDGNHRLNAAKQLGRHNFPAYVARFPTVDMAKAYAAAVNQLNGRRLTASEAFEVALTMFAMGLEDSAIAREIGRDQDTVRKMRLRRDFEARAGRLGLVEVSEPIKDTTRAKLATIAHDPVFERATQIAAETRASANEVNAMLKAANAATSDGEAIDVLEQHRKELAPAGPPPKRVTIPAEVKAARMHLGALVKLEENPAALLDLADDETRAKSIDRWRRVRDLGNRVLELYGEGA